MKRFLTFIFILLVIFFIILVYSRFVGTLFLRTNEYVINDKIDASFNNLKVVHFSDLHYKKVITDEKIKEIIKEINKLNADLVIFTGDLINKDYTLENNDINFLIQELSKIEAKYGCYSVLGDNDKTNLEVVKNIYIQSDFKLLDNSYDLVYNEQNNKMLITDYVDSNEEVFKDETLYKILITHEPDKVDNFLNLGINLVLAGHSLNGSVNIPYLKTLFLPDGALKYHDKHYKINNTNLYISSGLGVDRINFRLFNQPSINFYRLKNSN